MCIYRSSTEAKKKNQTLEQFKHTLPLPSLDYKGDRVTAFLFQTECLQVAVQHNVGKSH